MRTEDEMVAYALEIDPAILPFAPELLADLEELGCDTDAIVELLTPLQLPSTARVLDLGCGKGAASIAVAKELGLSVLGIELFEPFVSICRHSTQAQGVSHLCSFTHGNILTLVGQLEPVDVVIFAALGDTLGSLEKTVALLRQFVKPKGYIVLSDCFLHSETQASHELFQTYTTHQKTRERLTSLGDTILAEIQEDDEEEKAHHTSDNTHIRKRALALAQQHPALAEAFQAFVDSQQEECDFLETNTVSATWLLQRA